MRQLTGGVLLLLLAWPALRGDDKPKADAPSPKAKYDALAKEYREAQQAFFKGVIEAKGADEQRKRINEGSPRLKKVLDELVEFADKNPKDPNAVDALVLVVSGGFVGNNASAARPRAMKLLARDHVASPKLASVMPVLARGGDRDTETLLRAVLEKNPSKEAQAEAALALAQGLTRRASARSPAAPGAARLKGEAEAAVKEVVEKHLANLKPQRLQGICQQLSISTDKGSEALLRAMLKHDKPEVQGVACLTLAQVLKGQADRAAGGDAKAAEALRKEAEELFTRAAEKYGDVKTAFRGTVGEKAKSELYELRHLAIGKEAPDVEGEDQDGKKFTLSDYRGKVVLLDFWSQF